MLGVAGRGRWGWQDPFVYAVDEEAKVESVLSFDHKSNGTKISQPRGAIMPQLAIDGLVSPAVRIFGKVRYTYENVTEQHTMPEAGWGSALDDSVFNAEESDAYAEHAYSTNRLQAQVGVDIDGTDGPNVTLEADIMDSKAEYEYRPISVFQIGYEWQNQDAVAWHGVFPSAFNVYFGWPNESDAEHVLRGFEMRYDRIISRITPALYNVNHADVAQGEVRAQPVDLSIALGHRHEGSTSSTTGVDNFWFTVGLTGNLWGPVPKKKVTP